MHFLFSRMDINIYIPDNYFENYQRFLSTVEFHFEELLSFLLQLNFAIRKIAGLSKSYPRVQDFEVDKSWFIVMLNFLELIYKAKQYIFNNFKKRNFIRFLMLVFFNSSCNSRI